MSRNITTDLTGLTLYPAFLVDITFSTGPCYVWSGMGSLVWNSNTYIGVGQLGKVGTITEDTTVTAQGTSLTLSGIDSTILNDALSEIQIAAPATIWFATITSNGAISGTPYRLFGGTVDKPQMNQGPKTSTIVLNLENRLYDLQRPSGRLYTTSDQRYYYPTDSAFSWVEKLNDVASRWGG